MLTFRSKYFSSNPWYFYYDLAEFLAENLNSPNQNNLSGNFVYECNKLFERESSAYRFIDGIITPITSELELNSIDDSINAIHKFQGVSQHLNQALTLLSDRKSPDYRNSIKESISAVESLVKVITENPNGGLKDALKLLDGRGIKLHVSLREAFLKLYGYTSDEKGIRHSFLDEVPEISFDDAKYMLVTCSSFCNYIISKWGSSTK